ncbi:MAG: rhodanese-like domain-containing protein [Devosia sp.]
MPAEVCFLSAKLNAALRRGRSIMPQPMHWPNNANPLRAALLAVALTSGLALAITSLPAKSQEEAARFETITPDQLAQRLAHKDFAFINVHVPYEGEIAQTDGFIPFDQIAARLDKLPSDKSASIILYCRSGRMSEIAATTLASLGYTHVTHLKGGFNAWAASGRQLLQHQAPRSP